MEEPRPYLSSFRDRHGKLRWRYRRNGKTVSLPGSPGEPRFEAAYAAAVEGRPVERAKVVRYPNASKPRTFGAAWRKVTNSAEWQALDPTTRAQNAQLAELFMLSKVTEEEDLLWRDVPVDNLKRRHVKVILSRWAATPHKAKHILTAIRRMLYVALDEEWIEVDPTYKIRWRPAYKGFKPWTQEAMDRFEAYWKPGTNPRLAYALALWLGNRRSDIATLRNDQRAIRKIVDGDQVREVEGFVVRQAKGENQRGAKEIFVPITPMLAECLDASEKGEFVLMTRYGRPYSAKALTTRMRDWTSEAGLEPGYTLHGLRKTLGKMLAEGGASTRQLMETLGHDDIEHAELYSRAAEQARLATEGMDKVVALVKRRSG